MRECQIIYTKCIIRIVRNFYINFTLILHKVKSLTIFKTYSPKNKFF